MRENRTSGSEGGGSATQCALPTPIKTWKRTTHYVPIGSVIAFPSSQTDLASTGPRIATLNDSRELPFVEWVVATRLCSIRT